MSRHSVVKYPTDKLLIFSKTASYIISFVSFFISIAAIVVSLLPPQKPVITQPWDTPMYVTAPNNSSLDVSAINKIVSYDNDGRMSIGAGTTITTDVYEDHLERKYLKAAPVSDNIIVVASEGTVEVFLMNGDKTTSQTFKLSKAIKPEDMITFRDNVVLILTNSTVIPVTVLVDGSNVNAKIGNEFAYTDTPKDYPILDRLGNDCIIISHYTKEDKLAVTVGCVTISNDVSIEFTATKNFGPNKPFHGVSGLSANKFIVSYASAGSTTEVGNMVFMMGTYENKAITLKNPHLYENHGNYGYYDMDNLNDSVAIVVFVDEKLDSGLATLLLRYDKDDDDIVFGSYFNVQDGGGSGRTASGLYQFIYLRVLSDTRFGIYYSNVINGGTLCFAMCEVTPALDIVALGPEYVIFRPEQHDKNSFYYFTECKATNEKFYLVDCYINEHGAVFSIDAGYVKSNPFGFVTDVDEDSVSLATSGVVTLKNLKEDLVPGSYYYTNMDGDLVRGEFIGTSSIEGITVYITHGKMILSLDNRIGYAVDKNKLFIEREY